MGIADRRYDDGYNQPRGFGRDFRLVSFNTWIIIINVAVFVIQAFTQTTLGKYIFEFGYFSSFHAIYKLEFWRVITFQFLHADVMHILFNMLGLYFFGAMVERSLGFKKYAAFYLVCGIFGALMYLLLNFMGTAAAGMNVMNIPGLLYPPDGTTMLSKSPLLGASAGVFGVIIAGAYLAPNAEIQLIFPPIPMKLRTFAYGYVAIALISLLMGTDNAGGEAAHIGGALAGWFFIRRTHLLTDFFDVFSDSRKSSPKRPVMNRGPKPSAKKEPGFFAKVTGTAPPTEAEINRILDKLRAEGLASLTEREKDALRRATDAEREN
jgi:membrane associated rhomboid family serine protease